VYFPVLFCFSVGISQVIGCEDRSNYLDCVRWSVKLTSTPSESKQLSHEINTLYIKKSQFRRSINRKTIACLVSDFIPLKRPQ